MRTIANALIAIAASFTGAGISAIGVLAWNGFAYIAGLTEGSSLQGALVGGGLSLVLASALLATNTDRFKEDE